MKTPASANHHLDIPSLARFEPSFLDYYFYDLEQELLFSDLEEEL